MIGLFSGEGLKQSLSQGVAMTALHKVGGFAKDVAGQQEINNQIAIRAQTNGSLEVLHRVLGDQLGLTKVDPRNPNVMTYDPAMLPQWEAAAKARIDEMDRAGELKPADGASDGEAANMKSHVNGAIATLKVMALPPEERDLVANQIMGSFARYAKERTDVNSGSTPNALLPFVDKLAEISPETLHAAPKQNVSEQSGRWEVDWPATADVPKSPKYNGLRTPDNGLRLTGQGANKVNEARIQSYLAGVRNGTASPTVFAVNKKTAAALFRNSNAGITPDMIKEGKYPIDAENYMPVYGTMKDSATGKWVIQWTGTSIPQPERIGVVSRDEAGKRVVSGGKYAYNRDPALTPKEDGGLGMFPEEDHTYNNKTVNLAMKSQGVSVLPMKISAFMNDSIRPTNPYMIVKVGDNEWNLAKQVQEKIGEPATLNTLEENMHDLAAGTNKGNVQPIVNEVAKQLNARGHTASTVISSEKMIGVNEDRQRALHELDIKAQNVLTTSHTREQMKTNFQHSLGITLTPEEAKYALTNRSTLTGGDIKALTEKAIAEGRVEPKTAANYIVRVKPLEKSEAYRTSTIGMIHDTMPLLTPAEAHNAQASRVSLLTGKALLEQEPLIKASPAEVASTPEYQAVLDKLQTTGGGGTYAKQDLQSYAEQGIKVIKDSGLSAKEQSRLGVELQKMINRDDMNQRGVIMGPPEQVGSSLEDEIPSAAAARDKFNQHVQGVKDYIKESTGAGDVPSTKMTPEETIAARMEAVPVMTREQGTNFLQSAKTGIDSLPKDSYGYSFYKTFMGGLDKAFKGSKDPSKNYDLQRFMSWSNSAGKGYWAKQFETIDERTGEPISQPKTRTNKMAQGMHGADLRKESDIRNAELAAEIKPEGTPESIGAAETGGMSENMAASLPDWMKGQTENVPYEQGVKTVSSTQDPRNQYKDLTRMEAQVTPGRIALEGGVDAKGNPLPQITETNAGVEDGKRLVQDMMKEYNKFVNTAHAAGRWANPKMKFIDDKTWSAITTPIKEESNQTKKMSDVVAAAKTYAEGRVSKSKEAIDKLNKQDELLANVGGTRASAEAQKAIAENAKLREKLNALIKKYEGETGATKPDGGGGPGFDINSPAMVFGNLAANQPQMNPTGNNQPQNPIQMGPTTITSTIKSQSSAITPQVQLQEVDTTQAKNALNNARKALANPPTFGTGEMSQTTPAVGTPDPGLRKLKDSIGNLLPSNTWTFNQNTTPNMGIIKTPTGVQNPMISGIDLSRYATHPEHNTIVLNIKRTIPEIKGAQDVQKFIDAYVVKWNKTNKKNGTPPAGLGQMIWDSSQKAGVPVDLMTALAAEESVFGSQGAGAKTNNVGNIMNTGARTRTFKDWATGVQSMANFLAQNQQGRTAPAPITDKSLYKDLAIK